MLTDNQSISATQRQLYYTHLDPSPDGAGSSRPWSHHGRRHNN